MVATIRLSQRTTGNLIPYLISITRTSILADSISTGCFNGPGFGEFIDYENILRGWRGVRGRVARARGQGEHRED